MQAPADPLLFPSHFPPVTRWDKFFLGVRWIGPDLSFFADLKKQQAARPVELMSIWGGGLRQELAGRIARSLSKSLRWKTAVFLPHDSFRVIGHGPSFDWGDELALLSALDDLQLSYAITFPVAFWEGRESATFGEIVDALVPLIEARAR
jgi:hypothetical protein